jgi:ATP-binding cassette subfamily B protein
MFPIAWAWAARVRGWGSARWRSWWSIIRIVPQAGQAVSVAASLNLVIGVLPLGFVLATSVAIAWVPAVGRSPHGSLEPVLAAMTLAIVVLLLQSALSPFQAAFTELISRRVDGFCTRRLMRCTLAEAPVAQLEQAAVLDKLSDARRGLVEHFVTPGAAAAGLVTRGAIVLAWAYGHEGDTAVLTRLARPRAQQ